MRDLELAGEHDLGQLTRTDALGRCRHRVAPGVRRARTLRTCTSVGASTSAAVVGRVDRVGVAAVPTVVRQRAPSALRPYTTRGTTSVAAASRSKGSAPNATGPEPGVRDLVVGRDRREHLGDTCRRGRSTVRAARCAAPRPMPHSSRRGEWNAVTALARGGLAGIEVGGSRSSRPARRVGHPLPRVAVISWAIPTDSSVRRTWVKPSSSSIASISSGSGR